MKAIRNFTESVRCKIFMALTLIVAFLTGAMPAYAISKTDLTSNMATNKTFKDIAQNIDDAGQTGATLLITLVSIGGFVVVAISLYTLWRASKDEREKPLSAIVGLFIGGAMAGVGTIMWMMRNTVTGT